MHATTWRMSDPVPDLPSAGWGAAFLAALVALWKMGLETAKFHGDHRKTNAETEAEEALGSKAMAEARKAGVEELASILAQMKLRMDDLSAELAEERDRSRMIRASFLRFIGVVSACLPEMPQPLRVKIQAALETFQTEARWDP